METMKESAALMDELMNGVTQTELWNTIQLTDPMILDAEKQLGTCLAAQGTLDKHQIDDIRGAAWWLATAVSYSAILYGMRLAQAIQDISANPAALSRHILDRMAAHHE